MKNQRHRVARLKVDVRGEGKKVILQSRSPRGTYFAVSQALGGKGVSLGEVSRHALDSYLGTQEELPF